MKLPTQRNFQQEKKSDLTTVRESWCDFTQCNADISHVISSELGKVTSCFTLKWIMDTEGNVVSWNWNQLEIISDSLAFVVANVTQITLHFMASASSGALILGCRWKSRLCTQAERNKPQFLHSAVQMCCFNGHLRHSQLLIKKKASIDPQRTPERCKLNERPCKCCVTRLFEQAETHKQTHTLQSNQNNSWCSAECSFVNSRSEACNDPFECSKV